MKRSMKIKANDIFHCPLSVFRFFMIGNILFNILILEAKGTLCKTKAFETCLLEGMYVKNEEMTFTF